MKRTKEQRAAIRAAETTHALVGKTVRGMSGKVAFDGRVVRVSGAHPDSERHTKQAVALHNDPGFLYPVADIKEID